MSAGDWTTFHRRWSRLKPPLRASAEVVAAIRLAVAKHRDEVLLLGVTPELADVGASTVALDWSETMIAHVWPGDAAARRAILADWRAMPAARQAFSAAIGDGSLNSIAYRDYAAVFAQLANVLAPGARIAIRIYETPSRCETVEGVRDAAVNGRAGGFHAFKWRLAMAIAAERRNADVPVALVHARFEHEFPDRSALARATGWSGQAIDEIDAYAGSETVYSFPTRTELLASVPTTYSRCRFIRSGQYELAERCPIFVADVAA